jgi:hypothetical protein
LLAQFERELRAEVFRLKYLPNLNFGAAIERRPLEPVDRLGERFTFS